MPTKPKTTRRRRKRRSILPRLLALLLCLCLGLLGGKIVLRRAVPALLHTRMPLGEGIPQELLELAERNPEAYDFVAQYPQLHDVHPAIDLSAEAQSGEIPHLLQWDTRWGYEPYGSGVIAVTGCGPTCLSMAALYLTGDPAVTPIAVAGYAEASGYYTSGYGTNWTLMSEGCAHFGLSAQELPFTESRMREELDAGRPIICAMGPGDFTTTGHYIVVTGWEEGGFTVHDPNGVLRSGETWTFEQLNGQVRNLWSFQQG